MNKDSSLPRHLPQGYLFRLLLHFNWVKNYIFALQSTISLVFLFRTEIINTLRKGTAEWYDALCAQDTESERGEDLVNLITLVQIDLQQGLTYYHPLFDT